MRESGKWMSIVDDRILEYIDENGHGSPKEMKEEGPIPYSRGYINQRCQKLADHGLLLPISNGAHMLADRGKQYLEEELSTHEDVLDSAPDTHDTSRDDNAS